MYKQCWPSSLNWSVSNFQRPKTSFGQAGLRHKKMGMGRNTGGMRLNPNLPALMMGTYMHGIQLILLKLSFLALMCLWMPPQQIAAFHRWAGDAYNLRVRTGAMSGHGWSLLARGLKIFWHIFLIPHASNCPARFHPCNGVSNFWPAMCTPGHMPQYKENAAFAQPSPINLYIYTHIFIYK